MLAVAFGALLGLPVVHEEGVQGACVPLTAAGGVLLADIQVGEPWQTMKVVPDTGSYTLVLASSLCTDDSACKSHTLFDVSKSQTFNFELVHGSKRIYELAYGQGDVRGTMGRDRVGLPLRSWTGKPEQGMAMERGNVSMLEIVDETLKGWSDANYDGIMGMGKNEYTDTHTKSFLSDLGVDNFDLCLGEMNEGVAGQGGRIEFGRRILQGDYTELAAVGKNAWGVGVNGISVGGGSMGANVCAGSQPCAAIIDSGTTLLALPSQLHELIIETIESKCSANNCLLDLQKQETCSGKKFEQLPTLTFNLGGHPVNVPPSTYMGELEVELPTEEAAAAPFSLKAYAVGTRCVPLFMSMDTPTDHGPLLIMGMPFLREYATTFDRVRGGVSIAAIPKGSQVCHGCNGDAGTTLVAPEEELPATAVPLLAPGTDADMDAEQPEAADASPAVAQIDDAAVGVGISTPRKGPLRQRALDAADEATTAAAGAGAAGAASPSQSRQRRPIKSSQIRYPWWAVDPKLRPGKDGKPKVAAEDELSAVPWKLVL